MPVNTSIWQRSGEIIILFATLTALGALSRSASADPGWNDERAQVIADEKAAPAADKLVDLVDPIVGAPVNTTVASVSKPVVAAVASETAEFDPIEDLGAPPVDASKRDAKVDDAPASKPVESANEAPAIDPAPMKTAEPVTEAKPEPVAKSAPVGEPRVVVAHIEPNVGIVCVAGCYDSHPADGVAMVRKSHHVTTAGHSRTRIAEPARASKHRKHRSHEANEPHTTLASAGAVWPKRHPLCMANCPPEEAARTRAVYDALPELKERAGVVLPEAWIGVPLQQVAIGEALTVTGTMRQTSGIVLHTQTPGILRNYRMR